MKKQAAVSPMGLGCGLIVLFGVWVLVGDAIMILERPDASRGCPSGDCTGQHLLEVEDNSADGRRTIDAPPAVWVRRRPGDQQPDVQAPAPSNSMVRPLRARCAGTETALMKVSVLVPAITLPFFVATSLAWQLMTAFGLTSL